MRKTIDLATPDGVAAARTGYRRWRVRIFIACWTMYASYYLCRQNIAVAIPTMKELDWLNETKIGWITTGLFIAYSIGQLTNGILNDRFGPRRVATIGMVVSAAANVVFGLAGSVPMMMGAWIVNGYAQATGAPGRIKVFSNWFSPRVRGRMMGFLGTDYVIGNVVSWLLSGWVLIAFGWRYVFFVPAAILFVSAIHFWVRVRNTPESQGLPSLEAMERLDTNQPDPMSVHENGDEDPHDQTSFAVIARQALLNPQVWIVGFAYFGVDLFRYGFLVWSYDYLIDIGAAQDTAIIKIVMLPAIGAIGIVLSGWLTDRLEGRRAPVIAVMLFISGGLAWMFQYLSPDDVLLPMLVLGGIGFFLYGPHLLMGATIAMDLGSRRASATASGVIDALGYAGAAFAGIGTTWAKSLTDGDWSGAFILWVGGVLVAAVLMLFLWNVKPKSDAEYV